MPKLTDSQLVILATAAERPDDAVLPPAKSLKLNKSALATVLKSLIKRGLLAERQAGKDDTTWREVDGQPMMLVIADAGRAAIGAEAEPDAAATEEEAKHKAPRKAMQGRNIDPSAGKATARAGTKQAKLIALLQRKRGATIAEVNAETGWQAHSLRGAISGALKKKLGLAVTSEVEGSRGRVYRIIEKA